MPTNPPLHPKERESLEAATILRLTVTPPEEFHDDVTDAIETLERGDDVEESPTINFPTYEELASTFTPSVIELLETIRREEPSSINETARLVDRDFKNVHTELSELAQLHVIYFEEDGQAKRPVVWFDELRFEIAPNSSAQHLSPSMISQKTGSSNVFFRRWIAQLRHSAISSNPGGELDGKIQILTGSSAVSDATSISTECRM